MAAIHRFILPIQNETHLRDFIGYGFGVAIPDTQVCENHSTPWRAFCDAYFARYSTCVWKASRGFGGKTFMLGLLGLTEAATLQANVSLLGGSGEQSQRVKDSIAGFLKYPDAPRYLLTGDVAREMRFVGGNTIEALLASTRSARGGHPQRLRLDEIDEMSLEILDAATGQPMEAGTGILTQTVMSSTHQYADGTMTEILKRAAEKNWRIHEWCYRENLEPHGWIKLAELERKQHDVTRGVWDTEYELQEPNPEARAIMPESVKAMFKKSLGEFAGEAYQYIEIEPPTKGGKYCHGADWARDKNWTILWTLRYDVKPACFIAFERRGRERYPVMIQRLTDRIKRFGGTCAHDATGLGTVVEDLLEGVPNVIDFTMIGRDRSELLSQYVKAIENGEIEAPFIRYAESEHHLASRADLYASTSGHHLPDTISAGALANYARTHGGWSRGMGSQ